MLRLNYYFKNVTVPQICYSNTTNVKVKPSKKPDNTLSPPYSNTTNVKVKQNACLVLFVFLAHSNTTNVKVKHYRTNKFSSGRTIQIQPMLRLNPVIIRSMDAQAQIQIQPMLRLNKCPHRAINEYKGYSNTTNVKVKLQVGNFETSLLKLFKYNQC